MHAFIYIYTGWWFQPLGQNISQLGLLFPIYGKIRKCSKFQTTSIYIYIYTYINLYSSLCTCIFIYAYIGLYQDEYTHWDGHTIHWGNPYFFHNSSLWKAAMRWQSFVATGMGMATPAVVRFSEWQDAFYFLIVAQFMGNYVPCSWKYISFTRKPPSWLLNPTRRATSQLSRLLVDISPEVLAFLPPSLFWWYLLTSSSFLQQYPFGKNDGSLRF